MNNPIQAPGNYPAASWDLAQPAIKGPPPAPVVNAFRAILVRVALSLISLVMMLTSQDRIWAKLHETSPTLTSAAPDARWTTVIVAVVVFGIIVNVLWALLAFQVRKGKNWARIVTFVAVGLGLLNELIGLIQHAAVLLGILGLLGLGLELVSIVVSVAIVVLLAQRPAAEYFKRR